MPNETTSDALTPGTHRRSIPISYDFKLFEIVLRYFYTNDFCFITTPNTFTSDAPSTLDAEGIYDIAHSLRVECLERKALHFLEATCNIDNITARTLSKFAAEHEIVEKLYDAYFLEHWNEVRQSSEFEEIFTQTKELVESNRINTKFRKLMLKHVCK